MRSDRMKLTQQPSKDQEVHAPSATVHHHQGGGRPMNHEDDPPHSNIEPSAPTFRSIMMTGVGGGIPLRQEFGLTTSEPPLQKSSSPQSIPTAQVKPQTPPVSPAMKKHPLPVVQTGWQSHRLTRVGLFYPIEPCHTMMKIDQLEGVLQTLTDTFRQLSLFTVYKESPIAATCKSLDQIEFVVSILQSREEPDNFILEVQRRDGDCYLFQYYAQQILATVAGHTWKPPKTVPAVSLDFAKAIDSVQPIGDDEPETALELALGLIETERYDAIKLGLESLVHMTDASKTGWTTAKTIADDVLSPKNRCHEKVTKCLVDYVFRDASSGNQLDAEQLSFGEAAEADFAYLALIIIAQAMHVASKATEVNIESFLGGCPEDLVDCLMEKVQYVRAHPHQAYYAVKGLCALCEAVPNIRRRITHHHVEEAQQVGDSCHAELAKATGQLLFALQA